MTKFCANFKLCFFPYIFNLFPNIFPKSLKLYGAEVSGLNPLKVLKRSIQEYHHPRNRATNSCAVEQYTYISNNPCMHISKVVLFFWFSVKPAVIEVPRVKILNELYDTPDRQFPVGTAITLTCQGQVGSDKSNVSINCP